MTEETQARNKVKTTKRDKNAPALLWALMCLILIVSVCPHLVGVSKSGVWTFRLGVVGCLLVSNLLVASITGMKRFGVILWGFWVLPMSLFFSALLFVLKLPYRLWKVTTTIWGFHKKMTVRVSVFLAAMFTLFIGSVTENLVALDCLRYVSYLLLLSIALRVSERAFNPLGIVGGFAKAILKFDQNIVFNFVKSGLEKNKPTTESERKSSLGSLNSSLSLLAKIPDFMENPKLPLGMFLFNFIPSVAVCIFLFGIVYKSLAFKAGVMLSNSQSLLVSVYSFTGGNYFGLPELPISMQWPLGAEGLLAYYFTVVVVLAFGVSAQVQGATFGKLFKERFENEAKESMESLAKSHPESAEFEAVKETLAKLGVSVSKSAKDIPIDVTPVKE